MIPLISKHEKALVALCEQHFVKSLYLFGSAATGDFKLGQSDLDFVVEFDPQLDPLDFGDHFFDLLDGLKGLFQMEVDLLSARAVKNEVMRSEIERSKVELYAA